MKSTDPPIVKEQSFSTSVDELWKAISELEQMKQWFFDNIPSFKAEVGFSTSFVVENQGRVFLHRWMITEVVPLKKIAYNWRYEGYPGDAAVIFELQEDQGQTHLRVKHIVLEDYPPDIPEFARKNCDEGWTYFIQKRLKQYLTEKAEV
mgnify:CR=1 FL=1|jgi:uncharacterized protein YndB with AHSA1/START domain